jgi:glutaminyl-peptide cyclotransferase
MSARLLSIGILGVAGAMAVLSSAAPPIQRATSMSTYEVVKSYPHDRQAFTQGLVYLDGVFYEGTGLNGRSSIRKVKIETGEVLQQHRIDDKYFGEGIAVWNNTLVQLTWQSERGFVYDRETFKPLKSFAYKGEGWGLTHDGTRLIMSDGSASIRFLDPQSLKETGRITVRDGALPVGKLNELEFVKGELYANVYMTDRIVRFSPKTGQVTGWIDLTGLLPARDAVGADVLNGIAYDAAGDRLFVTGKLWPRVFEIRVVPRKQAHARPGDGGDVLQEIKRSGAIKKIS